MGEGGEEGSVRSLRTDEAGVRQRAGGVGVGWMLWRTLVSSAAEHETVLDWGVDLDLLTNNTMDSNYLFELNGRIRTSMEGSR